MKKISGFLSCVIFLVSACAGCSRGPANRPDDTAAAVAAFDDSVRLANLQADMAEMVEDIFANRGVSVKAADVALADSTGRAVEFGSFSADSTIYVYFTPLACWECIRTVCGALLSDAGAERLRFVVPESLRHAVGRIKAEAGVPDSRVVYMSGSLGLPVEDDNKIFLYTVESGDGVVRIENVFAPVADAGAVEAWLSAVAGCS